MSDVRQSSTRQVWALAFPIILSNVTVPLLGAVDTAVMGHLDSPVYLGAVAIGSLVFNYLYWGFGFLRMGTTGLTAQALGADNADEVRATLGRAVITAVGLGLLILTVQSPVIWLMYTAFEASAAVEDFSATYIAIRIWSAPAALVNYALLGWFIGLGRMRLVLLVQVAMNGLNIILDLVFVLGLGMTVDGVALATVIAEIFGMILSLALAIGVVRAVGGRWDLNRLRAVAAFRRLAAINGNLFLRTLFLISAFGWFTAYGARFGDVTLAANAVLLTFLTIASYALDGFAHAAETLVGQSVGRRNESDYRSAIIASTKLAGLVGVLFTLVFVIGGSPLIAALTGIAEVQMEARRYLLWAAAVPIVGVWAYQLDGIYLGATSTRAMRDTMAVSFVVYLGLSLWAMSIWGNHGLWAAFLFFFAVRGVALAVLWPRQWALALAQKARN